MVHRLHWTISLISLPVKSASLEPWFPPHLQRNIYLTLLHLEPEAGAEKAPTVPDSVLRAALLRRAVEDIHRIVKIRTAKSACTSLLAQGKVGDDLMLRFQRAELDMEGELKDVVMEVRKRDFDMMRRKCLSDLCIGRGAVKGLGPDHLPIGQRNCSQYHVPGASG